MIPRACVSLLGMLALGAIAARAEVALPRVASREFVRAELEGSRPDGLRGGGPARGVAPVLSFDALDRSGEGPEAVRRSENLRAIGLSLLLPGLAQLQAGDRTRGLLHLVAEGALWTAYASYRIQGHVREDSYVEMAQIHAGVQGGDRNDDYWKRLASYPSSDIYDDVIRREARVFFGDDLDARAAYLESHRISEADRWSWESDAARERYQEKRSDAQLSFKRSRDMVGLAVVNRVVAMIDAVLATRRPAGVHLEAEPTRDGARLQIRRDLP